MIVWTNQAIRQLDQAQDYIALSNSEEISLNVALQIVANIQQLESFPLSGRIGRIPETRELVISGTPFIVAYTVDSDRIVILAIYHGAREWPETF